MYENILRLLRQHEVRFSIYEHPPVRTVEDAEREAPALFENLIKTIAFAIKGNGFVLAGVRCQDRIAYPKLAAMLGINRRQLRSLSPQEVEAELGFEVGGVGAFPVRDDVQVIFDNHLLQAQIVRCGSGKNTRTLELAFADLLRVTGGKLGEIVQA